MLSFYRYRKYLYDYECSKEHLSTPDELQIAIDGNRREGRRSSYSTYSGNGVSGENSVVPRAQHLTSQMAMASPQITLPLIAGGHQHHSMQLNGTSGHNPLTHLHLPPQGNPLSQASNSSKFIYDQMAKNTQSECKENRQLLTSIEHCTHLCTSVRGKTDLLIGDRSLIMIA